MIVADLIAVILRLAELVFAAIIAGLNGEYLRAVRNADSLQLARQIYAEIVACFSILFAIIWLVPSTSIFVQWPADLFFSLIWFIAFGLLVDWLGDSCGYVFDWREISFGGAASCSQWKATIAFCFLSAICWLMSGILGTNWVRRRITPGNSGHNGRRPRNRY
ncbi:membrane-associating domain-containing protein [Chaetomium fimeti]|uniref:Membrane-associating domain-containing protein n=1 Tax=Chaetomium fimeti TaxID=1854472 RepID=A0AAE0LYK0_9PEZI|nr:membrane-associating domain-containing protein [Chaetomium fimeti]